MVSQVTLDEIVELDEPIIQLFCSFVDEHDLDDEESVADFGGVGEFLLFVELKQL